MSDPLRGGGGAFMDEGAHVALWFLWMFGAPRSVMGMVATSLSAQAPGVEDNGVLLYRYADGLIGVHQSSWTELAATTTVELFGDGGVLVAGGTDISSARSAAAGHAAAARLAPQPGRAGGRPARGRPAGRHRPLGDVPVAPPRQPPQRHRRGLRRSAALRRPLPGGRPHRPHRRGNGPGGLPFLARGARGPAPAAPLTNS